MVRALEGERRNRVKVFPASCALVLMMQNLNVPWLGRQSKSRGGTLLKSPPAEATAIGAKRWGHGTPVRIREAMIISSSVSRIHEARLVSVVGCLLLLSCSEGRTLVRVVAGVRDTIRVIGCVIPSARRQSCASSTDSSSAISA